MDVGRPVWSPESLTLIADRLEDVAGSRASEWAGPGRPVMVGIDGRSGAGKSTLADDLAHFLVQHLSATGEPPAVLRLDRIYPGWDGLEAGVTILADDVLPLLARGEQASYPRWDWLHHRTASQPGTVRASWCVIVEGVGSCARRCSPFLDLRVWVEAPDAVRYERAMARDGDTYRPHWARWAAAEQRHFRTERTASRCELHVRAA